MQNIGGETSDISLHAIVGSVYPSTMRVLGRMKGQQVVILIDIGSILNFLDATIISKVKLAINSLKQIEVRVANGERIKSGGKLVGADFLVQGHMFTTNFFLLPLEGCDIVLGIHWLRTLGPVLWDFASLTMTFTMGINSVTSKGLNPKPHERID